MLGGFLLLIAVALLLAIKLSAPPTTTLPGATGMTDTGSEPVVGAIPAVVGDGTPPAVEPVTAESISPGEATFTILAGGDMLPHIPVHTSARVKSGYDFSPLLAGLDTWVAGSDLSICHMEVPLAPDGQKISGYPMFAASPDLARDMVTQGWNGCSTASNHSVDRKFAGVAKTLDVFDAVGLGHVGTARTEAEAGTPQIYEVIVDGMKTTVAQLSATYGTNGLPIPAEQPWSVQLIDADELIAQAKAARKAGADLVLVSIHAGNEYQTTPTPEQFAIAADLALSGEVDLLIGHHAHVPQPMTKLDGGPGGDGMWVAYGLGNMLSNQDSDCCSAATSSGLLLSATATHTEGSPARVTGLEWIGITVDRVGGHKVHAFADVINSPTGVGRLSATEVKNRYKGVKNAVGTDIPERVAPPAPAGATVDVVRRTGG